MASHERVVATAELEPTPRENDVSPETNDEPQEQVQTQSIRSRKSIQNRLPRELQSLMHGIWGDIVNNSNSKRAAPALGRVIVVPAIEKLSEVAWAEAQNNPSSPEASLREWAQGNLDMEESNLTMRVIQFLSKRERPSNHPTLSILEQIFMDTWEKTWKQSWQGAWWKVMNNTIDKFWDRGVQEGVGAMSVTKKPADADPPSDAPIQEETTAVGAAATELADSDPGPPVELPADIWSSYTKVKDYVAGGASPEEHHWRIRSMFKALDLLHDALAHSIPASHQGVMEISQFADRVCIYHIDVLGSAFES